ncbi:hypothetical protein HMPREF0490_01832 [Lachnospiraceae bacterium 6_1_37FAA]|nr:hypothetical protein HMPREF0490_01832 [Lachnospiraceae bacterium 6_1_37FAA]
MECRSSCGCTISQWKCCRAGGCDRRGGGKWRAGGDHSAGRPGTDGKISGSEQASGSGDHAGKGASFGKKFGAYIYDSEKSAKKLARAVLEEKKDASVALYASDVSAKETANCLDILEKELEDGGCTVIRRQYRQGFEIEGEVVVAADPYTFSQIVNLQKIPDRLYGIGCSNKMLTLLEEGKVCAAVICNEYDKGYLSVEAAMKSIQNGTRQRTVKMEQVLVRQENLYDKEYEALLFPIS